MIIYQLKIFTYLKLVSCKMDTAHKTVTFQFAPDSDRPAVIAGKLVSNIIIYVVFICDLRLIKIV